MPTLRKPLRLGLLAAAAAMATVGTSPLLVSAADHLDAPAAKADHRVDITDVYAFKAGGTTLVLNVDALMTPADSKVALPRQRAVRVQGRPQPGRHADLAYRVRFCHPHARDGAKTQDYSSGARPAPRPRQRWNGNNVANGRTTPYGHGVRTARVKGGGSVFAGPRDDPFFFDLPGFVEFKKQLLGGSTDLGVLLGGFTGWTRSPAPT